MEIIIPFYIYSVSSRRVKKSVWYFCLAENLRKRRPLQEEEVIPSLDCGRKLQSVDFTFKITALYTLFFVQTHGCSVMGIFSDSLFYFITFKIGFKLTCKGDCPWDVLNCKSGS